MTKNFWSTLPLCCSYRCAQLLLFYAKLEKEPWPSCTLVNTDCTATLAPGSSKYLGSTTKGLCFRQLRRTAPITPKNHKTHQEMKIRQMGKSSLVLLGSWDSSMQPSSVAPWKPHLPLTKKNHVSFSGRM